MAPIKIGFLTPYSGVYPFYSQHIMAGMLMGLFADPLRQNQVQFIPVYTQQSRAAVQEAINKMMFFDQVDVISGLVSYKTVADAVPAIENFNKLGFFFDMGEYIPWFNHLSPNIFYASQQIWQSQYALGYWAQQQYGSTGLMVMPVYEAGYHLSSTFNQGAAAAGATDMRLYVLPQEHSGSNHLNLDGFFDELKKNPPAYVHAIFAGSAGNVFLEAWQQSGYHRHIPLTVVENMAYDDMLTDVAHLDLELYAASSWSRSDEHPRNQRFVKQFEATGGQMVNIFGLLGYEAGLALLQLLPQLQKRDWAAVKAALQKEVITGPRGERSFYPASGFALPLLDVVKVKTTALKTFKTIVSQGKGLRFDADIFRQIHDESVSGWLNPYMCI